MGSVPFRYLHHLVTLPVLIGTVETRLVLDTGIGLTLISSALAERTGWEPTESTFSGQGMSGQEVTAPLGVLPELSVGGQRQEGMTVATMDLAAVAGLAGVEGFLGLDYFRSTALTVDYAQGAIVLEDADSVAQRARAGAPAAVRVELKGPATTVFLGLELPDQHSVWVEVDMGSDSLILNAHLAAELNIDLTAEGVRRVDGQDETGHVYRRYFTGLAGDVCVAEASAIRQRDPDVMFQEIIYDGLLGDAFLRNFVVTYDPPNSRMIFGSPP
ncbi:MAG: retropepsin-like aspartic protease [Candidatus Dormibacteria bacterium]